MKFDLGKLILVGSTLALAAACPGEPLRMTGGGGTSPDAGTNVNTARWAVIGDSVTTAGTWQVAPIDLLVDDAEPQLITSDENVETEIVDGEVLVRADYSVASTVEFILTDTGDKYESMTFELQFTALSGEKVIDWTAAGPPPREHAQVIFHQEEGYVYVFGGSGYSPYLGDMTDFWRYDVATQEWAEITPVGEPPASGASRRVAGTWGSGSALIFGGYSGGQEANATNNELYRVTASGGELTFENIAQEDAPPARSLHGFVFDAAESRYFLFGGFTGAAILSDLWTMKLDGNVAKWEELSLPETPSARYGFFDVFDPNTRRWFIFSGGQLPVSNADSVNPAGDLWSLDARTDPPTFKPVTRSGTPAGRRNGCTVFDPVGPRMFIMGGTPDAMTTAPGIFVLDLSREGAEVWDEHPVTGESNLRASGFGFSDGDAMYCGGGNTTMAVFTDWHQLTIE